MKLVLFSDLHLDTPFVWAGPKLAGLRRQALRDSLVRIADLAHKVKADAVLCAGDLYEHDYFTPDTSAFVRHVFEGLAPIRVFLAPGNHDWFSRQSLYYQLSGKNIHVFTSPRLEAVTLAEGLTLWGAAHCVPANTDGFLNAFRADRAGTNLALFHGSEQGFFKAQGDTKQPHAPFLESQIQAAGLSHAFVGHFHKPQDAKWYTYPGCPEPLAFGDPPGHAVVIRISPDGSVSRERHSVASGRMQDVELDVTTIRSRQALLDQLRRELSDVSGVARVTLSGELQPEVDLDLGGLAESIAESAPTVALVLRTGRLTTGYALDSIAREQTVKGQFVASVRAADLSPEEERKILITGLRALEGRSDLEVP